MQPSSCAGSKFVLGRSDPSVHFFPNGPRFHLPLIFLALNAAITDPLFLPIPLGHPVQRLQRLPDATISKCGRYDDRHPSICEDISAFHMGCGADSEEKWCEVGDNG